MMVGYFRAQFGFQAGAINHGETPSSCNDEMGVGMDGQGWLGSIAVGVDCVAVHCASCNPLIKRS